MTALKTHYLYDTVLKCLKSVSPVSIQKKILIFYYKACLTLDKYNINTYRLYNIFFGVYLKIFQT